MASIENLVTNGNFENGELIPWKGFNAKIIASPCPALVDTFSACLKGGCVDASIEQLIVVIPDESYMLKLSLGTIKKKYSVSTTKKKCYTCTTKRKCSPAVNIIVEYLDQFLNVVDIGLESVVPKGQLPNSFKGKFNAITLFTTKIPIDLDIKYARIKISKTAETKSSSVVIDNVSLARVSDSLMDTTYPTAYVGNSDDTTVAVIGSSEADTITVAANPVAMIQVDKEIYLSSESTEMISVIDTTNNTSTSYSTNGTAQFLFNRNILSDPTTSGKVFVAAGTADDSVGFINLINIETKDVQTATVDPEPVALALLGNLLYVLCGGSEQAIWSINTSTNQKTRLNIDISTLDEPRYLLINDNCLIVGARGSGNGKARIRVYDVDTLELIESIDISSDLRLENLVLSLDNAFLYAGVLAKGPQISELCVYETVIYTAYV